MSAPAGDAQRNELVSAWREAAEAGVRYYAKMGGLALELAETVIRGQSDAETTTPEPPPPAQQPSTIVIEATAGRSGLGVFMVENTTAKKVSAPVGVSAFVDATGREVRPVVRFSPDLVSLEPGDQVLVQVAAAVDDTLEPGVRYQAEISIPRLSSAAIPLVVRRRPSRARASSNGRRKQPQPKRS